MKISRSIKMNLIILTFSLGLMIMINSSIFPEKNKINQKLKN